MTKENYMALADFQALWTQKIKPAIPTIAGTAHVAHKADKVGSAFDEDETYAVGDHVVRSGNLYRCTTAHTGAWDASDFELVTGNLAALGADGNLDDSGKKASDFASADLVPTQATPSNQLADKAFVNSSIATATATYRGSYNLVSDLSLTVSATWQQVAAALAAAVSTADSNDYCYVMVPTADATPTEIARVDRYKHNGTAWGLEYTLNNSGFTAAEWAAIQSNITSGLVAKLSALPTNSELTALLSGKASTTYVDDLTIIPVDLSTLTPSSTFVKRNALAINGVIYVARQNTENFPLQLSVQDNKFVTNTLNGETAYVVLNNTLNSDWEAWVDISEKFLIAQKQDRLTFDTTPKSGSTNPVTSSGIKAAIDSAVSDVNTTISSVCTKTKVIGTADVGSKISGWVELDPDVDLHIWPVATSEGVNLNIPDTLTEWRVFKVAINTQYTGSIVLRIAGKYNYYFSNDITINSGSGWYYCEIISNGREYLSIKDWEYTVHRPSS